MLRGKRRLLQAGEATAAADVVVAIATENNSRTSLPRQPYRLVGAGGAGTESAADNISAKAAAAAAAVGGDNDEDEDDASGGADLATTWSSSRVSVSLWQGELFRQLIALSFTWFAVTCAYYGLAFQAGSLPGSVYVTSSVISLADIPGNALYSMLVNRQQKKTTTTGGGGGGGVGGGGGGGGGSGDQRRIQVSDCVLRGIQAEMANIYIHTHTSRALFLPRR
jgi:hypothetical protein